MTGFLRRNPLIAGLAVLCAVLAAVVVVELVALKSSQSPISPRKVAPAEAKLLPQVAASTVESAYPETAARPLWIPTRRPAPVVATATQPAFVRGQYILQGVTIAGSTRIALLKEKASGRIHRVELGRDLNGLHVAEVEPERVTLSQGSEREVIDLRVQRPPAAPGAAGQVSSNEPARPGAPPPPQGAAAAATSAAPANRAGPFAPPPVTPGSAPVNPAGTPGAPQQNPLNTVPGAVPQTQGAAPMTPEELLARRRARRNQPTE
jgi:hypothetical protein